MGCEFCGGKSLPVVFRYTEPPKGETRFPFSEGPGYRREIRRCEGCRHLFSVHDLPLEKLYEGGYVDATYGLDGMRRSFDRIMNLDPSQSDNAGRVRRIAAFAAGHFAKRPVSGPPSILDVGSGLCVFLHRMKAEGWKCLALDPDERAVRHARETAGVEAVCADFMRADGLGRFDVISFNKVLEHVRRPVPMLARAARHLQNGGFAYVELPDGEAAALDGAGREEFFIEHWHTFSASSMALLALRAGFQANLIERLREPSGKYTLRAFLTPAPAAADHGVLEAQGALHESN